MKAIRRKAIKNGKSKTEKLSKCDKNQINIVKPLVFDVWCIVDSGDGSLVDCIFCRRNIRGDRGVACGCQRKLIKCVNTLRGNLAILTR